MSLPSNEGLHLVPASNAPDHFFAHGFSYGPIDHEMIAWFEDRGFDVEITRLHAMRQPAGHYFQVAPALPLSLATEVRLYWGARIAKAVV